MRKNVFRRGRTPEPEDGWMMYGHIIITESECVLINPPMIPDLIGSIQTLGRPVALILTTLAHSRGVNYVAEKTGAVIFISDQIPSVNVNNTSKSGSARIRL